MTRDTLVGTPGLTAQGLDDITRTGVGEVVLLAVPDEMARWGLAAMLRSTPAVRFVQSCAHVLEALEYFAAQPFDVLIIGSELLGDLPLISSVADRHDTKVVVLLQGLDDDTLRAATAVKCDGLLLAQKLTLQSLREALDRLQRGEIPIPAELAQRMMTSFNSPRRDIHRVLLTGREQQTLSLLAQGFSNKQIASRLGVSQHATKRYVANVLAKLNCPNRTLAVAYALRTGLLREASE